MPTYDYRCEATSQVFEVKHAMSVKLTTWGELCELAEIDLGDVSADSPVTKLITGGGVVKSSSLKNPDAPPCMTGGGCAGSRCGC